MGRPKKDGTYINMWGDQADASYEPTWNTYKNHTVAQKDEDN